jgi:hypothetical protein
MPFGGVGFPPPKSSGGKKFIKDKPGGKSGKKSGKPFGKPGSFNKGR